MRTFARRGEFQRELLDMGQLVDDVLALVDHELRLSGINTTVSRGEHVPPVMVDRIEIQQVLVNLIRNAIEAMARPSIALRRLTIRIDARLGQVRVSISDTGSGIDPAILGRLFHPFQSTKPTGLGLGLSICQTLIEAHGGRIGAEPQAGGGAMFFFDLPAAERTPS